MKVKMRSDIIHTFLLALTRLSNTQLDAKLDTDMVARSEGLNQGGRRLHIRDVAQSMFQMVFNLHAGSGMRISVQLKRSLSIFEKPCFAIRLSLLGLTYIILDSVHCQTSSPGSTVDSA